MQHFKTTTAKLINSNWYQSITKRHLEKWYLEVSKPFCPFSARKSNIPFIRTIIQLPYRPLSGQNYRQ